MTLQKKCPNKIGRDLVDAFLLLVLSVIPLWKIPLTHFVNTIDLNFRFLPNIALYQTLFTWFEVNSGYSNVIVSIHNLPLLVFTVVGGSFGVSLPVINKLWYIISLWVLGLVVHFFTKSWLYRRDRVRLISLSASFLVMFSSVTLVSFSFGWATKYLLPQAGALAVFLAFAIGMEKVGSNKRKFLLLGGVFSLIAVGLIQHFIVCLIFIVAYFFIFHMSLAGRPRIKENILFTIKFFSLIILINSWWLLPFIYLSFQGFSYYSVDPRGVAGSFAAWSTILHGLLLRNSIPVSQINRYLRSNILSFFGLLLPFFSFFALMFRGLRKSRKILFLGLTTLTLVFLASGPARPFGFIYKIMFRYVPFFYTFRDITKFNGFIIYGYSVLFPVVFVHLLKLGQESFSKKRIEISKTLHMLFIPIVLLIGFGNSYPLVTGNLGGAMESFVLPEYYSDFRAYIRNDPGRILLVPFPGLFSRFSWFDNKIHMVNPLKSLTESPLIYDEYRNTNLNSTQRVLWDHLIKQSKGYISDGSFLKQLALMNVRWVALQLDQMQVSEGVDLSQPMFSLLLKYTLDDSGLILEKEFEDLILYRVPDEVFLPHFYGADRYVFLAKNLWETSPAEAFSYFDKYGAPLSTELFNREVVKLAERDSGVAAEDYALEDTQGRDLMLWRSNTSNVEVPKMVFTKINPTKYLVSVSGSSEPYCLVFSESFHSDWRLYGAEGTSRHSSGVSQRFWSTLGRVLSIFSNRFLFNRKSASVVDTYFDGGVVEMSQGQHFIDPATFETWGLQGLEVPHFEANGYANSWCIDPQDVGDEDNYNLIVEFYPQRFLYLGSLISGTIICFIFLGWVFCKLYKFVYYIISEIV